MNYKKIYVTAPWEIGFVEDQFTGQIEDPNEIIVENMYSHLSAGTEMACVSGIEGWFEIPDVPGYTAVGRILEKGDAVEHVDVGDVVYTMGPHAGIFKVNVTDRWHGVCVKVPDGLAPDVAAFTHMGGIAMSALRASDIELGDRVAVSGLGAIGNLAAQFAQMQGAQVLGIDINANRLQIAAESGIGRLVNSADEDLEAALESFSEGKKVSTWIDASGVPAVINDAIGRIAPGGELILLGSPRASFETDITPFLQKIHLLDGIRVKGALEFLWPTFNDDFNKHSIERNSKIIMELMKDGSLKIDPVYSHKMHPADASEAYLGLRDHPEKYIGVIFDWTNT